MAKLKDLDNSAANKGKGIETLWQFVKFIVVSLGAFVIQTFLPYLIELPMSEEFLSKEYDLFGLGIYSSEAAAQAGMATTGLGLFIALTASNIIAQIVSFFINKDKTFNSDANTKVVLPIYIVFTLCLIAFSAWLQPYLVNFMYAKGIGSAAIGISGACCGAIQFFLYFPVDKLLFRKKKQDKSEENGAKEAVTEDKK
ncbi:MAG: hypothetical protein LUH40_07710 [Clostridiales bacterium]|nr:hypothetical protein [Clostridiales bacterium]